MLMSVEDVAAKIRAGAILSVAGDENLLRQLPKGTWIGGTIPYFMNVDGGAFSRDRVFVQDFTATATESLIRHYAPDALAGVAKDAPDSGFTVVIVPGMSSAHARYAEEAPDYDGIFMKQIVGWIAGIDLADMGKVAPKIFDGTTGESVSDGAIALHCSLPAGKAAQVGIVNLFEQGEGDVITFDKHGFAVDTCRVNGEPVVLAEYLTKNAIDTRLPLVASYHGEMINVSFQKVDAEAGTVSLYAPVFEGVEYRVAKPIADYITAFEGKLPAGLESPAFACNCILNYLYSGLEGKKTGSITGPVTFGEIAYQLVNQTLVYLQIVDA